MTVTKLNFEMASRNGDSVNNRLELPTSRQYIVNHPVTQMAQLHSSENMIAPTWTKVSKTAWKDKSELCGGFGRRMMNTSISSDAPSFFLNPENVHQPSNRMSNIEASVTRPQKKADPLAASYVLPGGASMLKALESPAPHNRFIKVKFGKQTYMDPIITERGGPKIEWGSTKQSWILAPGSSGGGPGLAPSSTGRGQGQTNRSDLSYTDRSEALQSTGRSLLYSP